MGHFFGYAFPLTMAFALACAPTVRRMPGPKQPTELGETTAESPSIQSEAEPVQAPPPPVILSEPVVPEPPPLPPQLPQPLEELGGFYLELDELLVGTRETPVRVMWMGDSHTAADFMTDEVRKSLQRAVPAGGPGYVRLGLQGYRHGEVTFRLSGKWRKQPILPAQRTRVLDGVFGYGGIRTVPLSGASVEAEVAKSYEGSMRWTLSYRLDAGSSLNVSIGEQRFVLRAKDEQAELGESCILSRTFVGAASDSFKVEHRSGQPEIFGAFVETSMPGVVFDTVGINGARAATALAWQAEQFKNEVKRRDIDLLVLAYGTNEVFDRTDPARYQEHLVQIVEMVREALPEIPCWIVGPPDAATDDGRSRSRVPAVTSAQKAAAQQKNCAFTSAYELMGGDGSFSRWMAARPSLARGDHIHLTIAGYRELGQLLARELVGESIQNAMADASEARIRTYSWPISLAGRGNQYKDHIHDQMF